MANNLNYPPKTPETYRISLLAGQLFEFVSAHTVFPYVLGDTGSTSQTSNHYDMEVFEDDESIFSNSYTIYRIQHSETYQGEDIGKCLILKANSTYKVVYTYGVSFQHSPSENFSNKIYYKFSAVENKLPLKRWSITDIINRTLQLAEPLRKGDKVRFKLNEEQAALFDKITAPEFAFTKQTLRECLQEIGKFIHGEPRLKPVKTADGWIYEVRYDMYAGQNKSGIYYMPYTSRSSQHAIENYASYLDSSAENLVNQLDKYAGVIVEPYEGGAKSVRTENLYVRIEEGNMLIATQYPIYDVQKLEYIYEKQDSGKIRIETVDITPYVFERSEYDGRLSSYDGVYPYSKMYALYFTQGANNIQGLNFKVPSASNVSGPFENYAIVNIISQATGDKSLFPFKPFDPEANKVYPQMCFRVTYTPFYNTRVAQTKAYYKDFKRPAALIFNQQSNVIESRYYGENLKGAIARLGTVEKSLTYILQSHMQVPKAGQMYDKDYYISAVSVEVFPTCTKCTIGLSKDFNRLSQYIGISSAKRYYEVSQTQALERNTLYREYIVIGEKEEIDTDCMTGEEMLNCVAWTFSPQSDGETLVGIRPVTNVIAHGASLTGASLNSVNLPVISSAFGNSISFSWKYEDNYSAGAFADYQNNDNVSGYFQNGYRYTDYYGRLYYYYFDLYQGEPAVTSENVADIALKLPGSSVSVAERGVISTGDKPCIMRKDNREALQINFQIDFVSNVESLIIGSALASYNPAVRGINTSLTESNLKAKLYVFPTELNKFTDHVEAFEDVDLNSLPSVEIKASVDNDGYMVLTADNFPSDGKSWAIVTPQRTEIETVEDEYGEPVPQTTFYGGDLLIGQNIEVESGQEFTPIYFTKKREIFDKSVWADKR